jgi:plasmid maintenance system antidote protein VapI
MERFRKGKLSPANAMVVRLFEQTKTSQAAFCRLNDISTVSFNEILFEKRAISPLLDVKLCKAFNIEMGTFSHIQATFEVNQALKQLKK